MVGWPFLTTLRVMEFAYCLTEFRLCLFSLFKNTSLHSKGVSSMSGVFTALIPGEIVCFAF